MTDYWKKYQVKEDEHIKLTDWDTSYKGELTKDEVYGKALPENLDKLAAFQNVLYADNRYGLLIVLQAMDAAGKDGLIKHVFTAMDPQGTQVSSFKKPSSLELDHDYLWRCNLHLPRRGNVMIFNRSHYEDVLVTRVHNLLEAEGSQFPKELSGGNLWKRRFKEIRNWEEYLTQNGIVVLKFFLHISKEEQKERLLSRIDEEEKNWKFSSADINERKYWDDYQHAYEEMISATSTSHAPWFIIPADRKWYTRYVVSEIVKKQFESMSIAYPALPEKEKESLKEWRNLLTNE